MEHSNSSPMKSSPKIAFTFLSLLVLPLSAADLRLGMIGMDTGHSINFTELLNQPQREDHVPGARVVAAFKVSSPDIESSWSRVDKHADRLRDEFGVTFYDSIEAMLPHVDAVLMEDNDARRHVRSCSPASASTSKSR